MGLFFPIYGKHVPNHQAVYVYVEMWEREIGINMTQYDHISYIVFPVEFCENGRKKLDGLVRFTNLANYGAIGQPTFLRWTNLIQFVGEIISSMYMVVS